MSAIKVVVRYLRHLRAITIIRHLIPVIIVSQQHRGASLAFLEGDNSYKNKVSELQNEIEYRLTTLQLLNRELSKPVKELEIDQLVQEWWNIKGWSEGTPLENFNLHNYFIEQQMRLVWRAKEKTNYFFMDTGKVCESRENASDNAYSGDALLIRFVLHDTLELIELIAKTRGLATHAMVVGACDIDHYSWLEYLLREINLKKEKFRILFGSLQQYMLRDMPSLIDLQLQDSRMVQLVQYVENNILRNEIIRHDSQDIFIMATTIINSLTEVIYQGLDFIQNRMHRQFDERNNELV